jgi:hypothetical protein
MVKAPGLQLVRYSNEKCIRSLDANISNSVSPYVTLKLIIQYL